jgi:hypothetical protein
MKMVAYLLSRKTYRNSFYLLYCSDLLEKSDSREAVLNLRKREEEGSTDTYEDYLSSVYVVYKAVKGYSSNERRSCSEWEL